MGVVVGFSNKDSVKGKWIPSERLRGLTRVCIGYAQLIASRVQSHHPLVGCWARPCLLARSLSPSVS